MTRSTKGHFKKVWVRSKLLPNYKDMWRWTRHMWVEEKELEVRILRFISEEERQYPPPKRNVVLFVNVYGSGFFRIFDEKTTADRLAGVNREGARAIKVCIEYAVRDENYKPGPVFGFPWNTDVLISFVPTEWKPAP